jgi:hypothetical protein
MSDKSEGPGWWIASDGTSVAKGSLTGFEDSSRWAQSCSGRTMSSDPIRHGLGRQPECLLAHAVGDGPLGLIVVGGRPEQRGPRASTRSGGAPRGSPTG